VTITDNLLVISQQPTKLF